MNCNEKILNEFESYCQTPGIESGKARSYAKAILYLCDFLSVTQMDEGVVAKIKSIKPFLSDPNNIFYEKLLEFLNDRGQSSYLKNGFITAALKYFFNFWHIRKINN